MIGSKLGYFFAIALLLGTIIHKNEALTCYYGGGGRDFQAVNCGSSENLFCRKQEVTYQGALTYSRECAGVCIENAGGTTVGNYLTKTFCCTTDKCNLALALSSNKILTVCSILTAAFLAFFKIN